MHRPIEVSGLDQGPALGRRAARAARAAVAEPWHAVGVALNRLTWTAFLVELVVMLAVTPNRRSYMRRNPLDLVIVVLTPPFLGNVLTGCGCCGLSACWIFRSGGLRYAAMFTGLVVSPPPKPSR